MIDTRSETFPSDIRRNRGMMIPNSTRVVILAVKSRQWARAGLFQVKKDFCGEDFYGFQNLGQRDESSRTFILFGWVNCSKVAGLGFFFIFFCCFLCKDQSSTQNPCKWGKYPNMHMPCTVCKTLHCAFL